LKFFIVFKQFLQDIRKQKLRTALTTFGIVWGTAATVILVSFGEGLYKYQQKRFHGLGNRITIVWPGITSKPYKGLPKSRTIRFTDDDVDMLKRKTRGISLASPEYSRSAPITYERKTLTQSMKGVYPEWGTMRNIIPEAGGRFINEIDQQYRKRVVFLGTQVRDKLFGEGVDPVGKYVTIKGVPFLVVGVMKDKEQNSSYSGRDRHNMFVASSTFKTMFDRRYPNNMVYQVPEGISSRAVLKKVYETLGRKYKFDPDDEEALMVWDTVRSEETWAPFFEGFKIFLGIIGVFTLIVGGIGTANIMYVVVKERTKEIGIKMALGASRAHIMGQIIFESLLITAIGGLIGFSIAKFFEIGFPELGLAEFVGNPIIATDAVLATVTIIGTIGFLAGFFPARRASKLNPVEALRL
jgi:putative ABC transport system permease protein